MATEKPKLIEVKINLVPAIRGLFDKIYDSKFDRVKKAAFLAEETLMYLEDVVHWKRSIWDNGMDEPAAPDFQPEGVTVREVIERK